MRTRSKARTFSSLRLGNTRVAGTALAVLAAVALVLGAANATGRVAATPDQVGQWSAPVAWPLVPVHAALEDDGLVRVFDAFGDAPNSERLWDPASGTFAPVPYGRNLFCSGHVILADGRDLIVGGHIASNVGLNDTTIFDPKTRTWTRAADMTDGRWYPTATTLSDGRVLVVSGDNMILGRSGVPQAFKDTSNTLPEVFNPATNTWARLTTAQRFIPLYPYMFVMPDGRVFDAGPDTINRALDVATQTWTTIATSPIDGGSAVMYRAGKILKAGRWGDSGVDYQGDGRATVIDLNQPTPAWREVAPMAFARQFFNLVSLPDGNVLAVGGSSSGGGADPSKAILAAELWNPNTETWSTVAAMQTPRMYHATSLLLPDGRVLVAGGGRFASAPDYPNAEIYSPPYLFKGPRPTMSAAPSAASYGSSFSVTTPDAASISSIALIRTGSMTHAFDENARFVSLSFTKNTGSLTVQAPANANLAPPGPYMLFIVDSNGVPSVARFVRMQSTPVDSNPPTVSITAPTNGSTVSGTTTVTANATDDVGVLGVQFKVDGNPLGAEDTTAPYSIAWDTTTLLNGAHVLTAVARDGGDNTTTSAQVTVTASNQSPGLVASYSFDAGQGTTLADVSGHGNNGTLTSAAWTSAGKFGSALSFNGSNSWVTVPDSNSLDLTSGMTLEAWVNPSALGSAWRTVIFKEQAGKTTYDLYAGTGSGTPEAGVWIGAEHTVKGTSLALNTWSHLTATFDGATLRIYVNGVLAGSVAQTGSMSASTGALRFGGNSIYPEWFSGLIDEVRIYNRALPQAEIQADMNRAVGVVDTQAPTAPTGLAASGLVSSVNLSWTASSDNVSVSRYNVHRSTTPGFTASAANRIAQPTGTSYVDSGLAAGTYYYKVIAEDGAANLSAPSNEAAGTVTGDVTPPTAPGSLSAAPGPGQATLNWTASTDNVGVTRYDVHRSTTPGFTPGAATKIGQSATPGYADTGLTPGTYYYRVIAFDASSNASPASNEASVTVTNAPPTGLVAAYGFDEGAGMTLTDLSGNANTGTLSGPAWTAGKYGSALSFDGVNDWVSVADSSSLDLTSALTLEAWVRPASLGTSWRTVLFKEQGGNLVYGLYGNRETGAPNAQVFVGGTAREADGAPLALNTWTHLAATYDGAALKLWANGTQTASLAVTGNITASNGVLRVGGNNIWPEWFNGLIDEVRIYNRALSQAELQADMNRPVGSPDTQAPTVPSNVTATGAISSVALSWTASTDNVGVARYNVHRSTTPGFTPSPANRVAQPTGTTYTDPGLAAGTYYYKLTAEDAGGNLSGPSSEVSATVTGDITPPVPPGGLTAIAGPGQASLSWASSTDNVGVVRYDVYRSTVSGFTPNTSNRIAQPTGTSYTDTGLSPGTYFYVVAAEDASSNISTPSNQASATVASAPPPTGLVASYGFDEGSGAVLGDSSGNANNGAISGATWSTAGKFGSALSFNGTNNLVSIPDSSSLDLTTALTLEAWVRPAALGTVWRTVLMKEQAGNLVYDLYANTDKGFPETALWIGGERAARSSAALPLNTWTHLASTYDGTTVRLYVNGVQAASLAQTGNVTTSTGSLRIGGNNVWPEWFSGHIDEVRVYNRALTPSEITADMNRSVTIAALLGMGTLRPLSGADDKP